MGNLLLNTKSQMESGAFLEQCGQAVSKDCVGTTVEMTETGWKQFTAELGGASEFSFTMMRAINAAKCMVTNLGNNFWNMFGVIWYVALEFKFEAEITKYVA